MTAAESRRKVSGIRILTSLQTLSILHPESYMSIYVAPL